MTAGERGGDGECMVRDDSNGRSGSEGLLKVLRKEARESLCVCLPVTQAAACEREREREEVLPRVLGSMCVSALDVQRDSLACFLSVWMRETGTHFSAIHPFPSLVDR